MHVIDSSHEFTAPLDAVWALIQDFGHIERWWPKDCPIRIEKVVLEGKGVGMVRHIYNAGFPTAVSERLDYLDDLSHTWKLSIVGDRPAGLSDYQATGHLSALPGHGCRIDYHSEFTTISGAPDEARVFLLAAYELMYQGFAAASRQNAESRQA